MIAPALTLSAEQQFEVVCRVAYDPRSMRTQGRQKLRDIAMKEFGLTYEKQREIRIRVMRQITPRSNGYSGSRYAKYA